MKNIILILSLIAILFSCSVQPEDKLADLDLGKIIKRGKLIVLTGYNPYSYFIYKGEPEGFEYELLSNYANSIGLELEMKAENNFEKMISMLNSGGGDIIAFNLTVTNELSEKVQFTKPYSMVKQLIVQRISNDTNDVFIDNVNELEGKTVYVRNDSPYLSRLRNLEEEISGEIMIIEADPDLSTEDLIQMVAEKKINYTIADDNIARLAIKQYKNISISTEISFPQKISWAVRQNSPQLLNSINNWIESSTESNLFRNLKLKYFENWGSSKILTGSKFFMSKKGDISPFDELIKKYSQKLGWDWKLVASLIYQESQFEPKSRSWVGAVGLMQLMPNTGAAFGVTDFEDPEQNINAGISYLIWLNNYWKKLVYDESERMKFVLASYNIGVGHILDARNLAFKYDSDPNIWEASVSEYLLNKSKKKYYEDEVVQYGYARGNETVNFVREVLERFQHYKQAK
ncbi:MAG: transporter substrate-binding domain-containing protein [Melioribacteraceae bacterium]|nr:transporter substrate-binding domain-containing protein [Melioribacteraceae bacterium]